MSDYYAQSRRRFLAEVGDHVMTVLHDDGLYRHIRFAKPGTGIYRFDLVTWPGHLSITGDLESFTFRRVEDMFDFFASGADINPGYWGEKVIAGRPIRVFDEDTFARSVTDTFMYRRGDYEGEAANIWRELRREMLDERHILGEHELRYRLANFDAFGFRFYDVYDMAFDEYDVHYLRACQAIRWGIAKYRASQAVAA